MHIYIETVNVEAEVARLQRPGVRKREKVKTWWIVVSSGNHLFCVGLYKVRIGLRVRHSEPDMIVFSIQCNMLAVGATGMIVDKRLPLRLGVFNYTVIGGLTCCSCIRCSYAT